jgi:2'-5' RNA ligase
MSTGSLKVYMARVFSAVDIEDKKLLNRLEDIRETLNLGFNPVEKEKMHITLEFFEDIDEEEIQKVKKAIDKVDLRCFNANVKDIGVFPSEDYIRVVWAGLESAKFKELYNQVSNHSVKSSNKYDFKPHITLLRVKSPSKEQKKKLKRTIREFNNQEFGKLSINNIKLFESHLNSKNTYKQLHKKVL